MNKGTILDSAGSYCLTTCPYLLMFLQLLSIEPSSKADYKGVPQRASSPTPGTEH